MSHTSPSAAHRQEAQTHQSVDEASDQACPSSTHSRSQSEPFTPLTYGQAVPFMICCPEYPLIELHIVRAGLVDSFTVNELATSTHASIDTAQRWIDKAMSWNAISRERSADLKTCKDSSLNNICKNAERTRVKGAAVARRYRLTPELAAPKICQMLPDLVQELMQRGDPAAIRHEEGISAGLDATTSADLELISEEIATTVDALEVTAEAERAALAKAHELQRAAERDRTPFSPDRLPSSVSELRIMRIEHLIASDPHKAWKHSDFMWQTGVKRGSVSALIKKSRYKSAKPVFENVPIGDKDHHEAVRSACRKYRGIPVMWLDKDGKEHGQFSAKKPDAAAMVRIYVGKTYVLRENPDATAGPATAVSETDTDTPEQEPELSANKAQRRRIGRGMMRKLWGCAEARGWRMTPGRFGYWQRGDFVQENTLQGLVAALKLDHDWAVAQRSRRQEKARQP